jgi:hypothetical protein
MISLWLGGNSRPFSIGTLTPVQQRRRPCRDVFNNGPKHSKGCQWSLSDLLATFGCDFGLPQTRQLSSWANRSVFSSLGSCPSFSLLPQWASLRRPHVLRVTSPPSHPHPGLPIHLLRMNHPQHTERHFDYGALGNRTSASPWPITPHPLASLITAAYGPSSSSVGSSNLAALPVRRMVVACRMHILCFVMTMRAVGRA